MEKDIKREALRQYFKYFKIWFIIAGILAVITIGAAVVLTAAGELVASPMLALLKTPENIVAGSLTYLRVMIGGLTVITFYNLEASLLRALGDGRSPLTAMVIAFCTNIGLDLLFVMGFRLGIAGAAVATLMAQGISCIYCFVVLRRVPFLKLKRQDFAIDISLAKRLLRLGMPVMFQDAIISIGGMVLQSVINGFGVLFVAGFTATNKLYGILETAAISYGYAISTFVAQNKGAGRNFLCRDSGMSESLSCICSGKDCEAVSSSFMAELLQNVHKIKRMLLT